MDTREKIIDAAHAARIATEGAVVASGYFDPMTAPLAARLAGLKQNGKALLVLIAAPEDEILPSRARAQLVASLKAVDFVCDEATGLSAHHNLLVHHNLQDEHSQERKSLVTHVHARQRAK